MKLLVNKEITLKYKRTYLGFIWSMLNPLLTAVVYYIAFGVFMRFEMKNYTLFLLAALFPWSWFAGAATMSANVMINNVSLIKKVIFPKQFLIVALITGHLMNLLFTLPILLLFVLYYGQMPAWNWLYGIPMMIVLQFAVTYGLCLILSMINAFFRDMEYIIGVCVNMLFWMTPIIYPLTAVPEKYRILMVLNPVTYLMEGWRDIILNNTINWNNILIAFITAVVLMGTGILVFNRLERKLDEVL